MLPCLIFDLDGTLLDTLDDLRSSLNYALQAKGLPLRTREQVREDVGNGVRVLIERSIAHPTPSAVDELLAIFRPHYAQHASDTTAPYPGILPMLRQVSLRGYRSAIVSNKPDAQVKALHQRFFPRLILTAIGEQLPAVRRKPAPDMVILALQRLQAAPCDAIYIGDSEVDLQTAQNAHIPCISCAWGFRGKALLQSAGARTIIEQPEQLIPLIEAWSTSGCEQPQQLHL